MSYNSRKLINYPSSQKKRDARSNREHKQPFEIVLIRNSRQNCVSHKKSKAPI